MNQEALPLEASVRDIVARREAGEKMCLIDVREPGEWQICHIDGANLLPMNTVPANLQALEKQADETTLIVYCHHGMRSLNTVNWLRAQGVSNCQSMAGGIDRWSLEIDPSVPRY